MSVGGVNYVQVPPDERTVWRCEWNLWVLTPFHIITSVQVIARASGTTEHKIQQRSSGQKHSEGSHLARQAARKVRILSSLEPFRLGYNAMRLKSGMNANRLAFHHVIGSLACS